MAKGQCNSWMLKLCVLPGLLPAHNLPCRLHTFKETKEKWRKKREVEIRKETKNMPQAYIEM